MISSNLSLTSIKIPEKYQPYLPYTFPIIGSLASFAVAVLMLLPAVNEAFSLKSDTDTNGVLAEILETKLGVLEDWDQVKLTEELAKTGEAIPSEKDPAIFLSTLSQIASDSGSTVDSIQLVTAGGGRAPEKNSLDFQMIIKGNYATIKGFLTKIETARRVMVVKSIGINVAEGGRLSADISLTGYYEPLVSLAGTSDTPLPERGTTQEKLLADLEKRTIYVPPTGTAPSVSGRSDPFTP